MLIQPILPYEYLPIATRFADRLQELAALNVPEIDMQGAVARAQEFQALAGQLDRQSRVWRQRSQEGRSDDGVPDLLNQTMIRLSRVLVPIASTVVGPLEHCPPPRRRGLPGGGNAASC